MSKNLPSTPNKAKHNLSSSPSGTPAADLARLDARLKNLTDNVIQLSPYILTVPSSRPYNLDPRQAHEWKRGTPFDDNEEQLQYLSFLPDWDNGLITPVGAWDNERGEVMDRSLSQQSAKSATSIGGTPAKVKHSLSDYMKKTTGGPSASTTPGELRKEKLPNGNPTSHRNDAPARREKSQTLKRSREDGEITESESSHSAKKQRPSPPRASTTGSKHGHSDSKDLDLPPFISPTLPPAIEKELERLSTLESKDKQNPPLSLKKESSRPDNGRSPERRAKHKHGDQPESKARPNGVSKHTTSDKNLKPDYHSTSNGVPNPDKRPERDSLRPPSKLVKLKIPRSIRLNVARLLLTTPKRRHKKIPESSHGPSSLDRLSPHPDSRKDKRTHSGDDERRSSSPSKRSKHQSNTNLNSKPSTPLPAPSQRSPIISQHGSASKKPPSATSHPSEGKSLAPHHDEPSVSTPQGAIRNNTPSAPDSADRGADRQADRNTSSEPHRRLHPQRELRDIEKQHWDLGRSSKRSSDRETANADGRTASSAYKRGLALGVECILSFMLSYAVRDELNRAQQRRQDDHQKSLWPTIFPFLTKIKGLAEPYPALKGVVTQLEAVCCMAVWNDTCDQLNAAAGSGAGGGGAASNTASSHATASLESSIKHHDRAFELFIDGAELLPVEDLQTHFADTWARKARIPLAKAQARRFDPKVEGEYYLPLSSISTAVESVRAGRMLLGEWCRNEGLEWTGSLGRREEG